MLGVLFTLIRNKKTTTTNPRMYQDDIDVGYTKIRERIRERSK